ncbi:MAG: acetylxylan esterase [Verrucomicrobia bacterium]|nr:acetylxylan esterase [Verrucomicrobiota bacterium]
MKEFSFEFLHCQIASAIVVSLTVVCTPAQSLLAQEQPRKNAGSASNSPMAQLLKREIISPNVALEEVQSFLESRIPRMPTARNAAEWQKHADQLRSQMLDQVVFRGQAAVWRSAKTKVEWLDTIDGGPGYRIRKLRYEALPGLWMPAVLYLPENLSGKVPVALNVNGHDPNGKAAPYKQIRCINLAKRGVLVLNPEWFGMGQLRGQMSEHYRMNQLDLCGTSGLAPFFLAMTRGLDVLLSLENADPERVAVSGLSGGGWQTIYISALDTRVKLANPVAGYSSFLTRVRHLSDLGDSEQTPSDMATVADYAHLTAMLAPRSALLTYNAKDDCCFASGHALPPLLEAAAPIYKLFGQESRLRSHVNHDPGTHNYEKENREQFYRLVEEHFFARKSEENSKEIPSESEVKTKEQLQVELPAENADFHSLALDLSKSLPREAALPSDPVAAKLWQQARRPVLHQIVRTHNYTAHAEQIAQDEAHGVQATFWKLKLAGLWTVPVVELTRGEPKATTILVADGGRTNALDQVNRLLALGNRVLAVDPFYVGESKIKSRDYLYALFVAAVGERPLGVQASQLTAIARWSQAAHQSGAVAIVAIGARCSLAALVASALESQAIDGVELHGALGSLKEIIEQNWAVNEKPELFCFGLLEAFDVKQLTALAAPTPIVFPNASDRVKKELANIQDWYKLFGVEYQPW